MVPVGRPVRRGRGHHPVRARGCRGRGNGLTAPPVPADPTLADVEAAAATIAGLARETPLRHSPALSEVAGGPVYLKLESEQETGSFKIRGAANKILGLSDEERSRGLVTVSSGNHGRAVAYVAGRLGVAATVCITSRVPAAKADAIAALGAEVRVAGDTQSQAEAHATELAAGGLTLVHPFDDPAVIAGQGTVGLEIRHRLPGAAAALIPLSGGGLASGVALALASTGLIRAVGVSQDRGPAMHLSLAAGRLTDVIEEDTLADALAGGLGPQNRHTMRMCRTYLDGTVLVTEAEIGRAMAYARDVEGITVEGGGAVGIAALLAGRTEPRFPAVVIVSGGNVADAVLASIEG